MADELVPTTTQLGGMPFHIAGALCYVPFFLINYIAPPVFFLAEPKEHHPVRFHAMQSMLFTASWIAAIAVTTVGMILLPVLFIVAGSATGMDDVGAILGSLAYLGGTLLLLVVSLGGMLVHLLLAVLTAAEKDPRIPVLGGLAARIAGVPS